MATEAIIELPTCCLVRCSSPRMIGISGASPNQPKKQRKNASHVTWKARIGALWKSSSLICVALWRMFIRLLSPGDAPDRAVNGDTFPRPENGGTSLFLLEVQDDLAGIVHPNRVGLDTAIAKQCLSRGDIELPAMQGTDQRRSPQ